MQIKPLTQTPISQIVDCLTASFKGYFVPMPSSVEFWDTRFKNAGVNLDLSWGVFDNNKLIAFVINAIGQDEGALTAFNTGTGVLEEYRGNQLVDKMYEYGMPTLKTQGISRFTLEVISKNDRAIRVYERIGFTKTKTLKCYKGELETKGKIEIEECDPELLTSNETDVNYSWDNRSLTIARAKGKYKGYRVKDAEGTPFGYFIINPKDGYLSQLETQNETWEPLFNGISQISQQIRINNVNDNRRDLIDYLQTIKIENTIDQYEMEMKI